MQLTTEFQNCLPVSHTMIPVHEVSLDYRDGFFEQEGIVTAKATFLALEGIRPSRSLPFKPVVLMFDAVQASNRLSRLEVYGIRNIGRCFDPSRHVHISHLTHFTCESSGLTVQGLRHILQAGVKLHAVRICRESLSATTKEDFQHLPREIKHLELIDCNIYVDVQTFLEQKYPRIARFTDHEHSH